MAEQAWVVPVSETSKGYVRVVAVDAIEARQKAEFALACNSGVRWVQAENLCAGEPVCDGPMGRGK